MARESRVHPRLRLDAKVDVIGREVVLNRRLEDISMGGCRITGQAWESVGAELQLVIAFPALGASVPVRGIVVRAGERDTGIRFDRVSDEQKWALRKHIRELQGTDR